MNFQVRPLSEALGAEVLGLDLSRPLDDATFASVRRAFLEHLVLVFRDQALTPAQQVAFSRRFGTLDEHPADDSSLPGHPEVLVVSTKRENGKYVGLPDAGPMWHSDLAYMPRPALGSFLYALEVPDHGGDTSFANMYKAYETLPADLKDAITGRRAVFLAGRNNPKRDFRKRFNDSQRDRTPSVTHPVIRTHPETGRKSIFVSAQHTVAIEGLPDAESERVLAAVVAHSTRPEFVYRHSWRTGDLTFWDNRCVQHIADLTRIDDPTYIRHMYRTTVEGDVPA